MFDKNRTKWHFILLGQDLDQRVRSALENQVIGDGNYYNAGNISISVFEWSKIIQDNKLKYEYLRKKLNHQLSDDPNFAVDYLRAKHAELLLSFVRNTLSALRFHCLFFSLSVHMSCILRH